MVGWLALYNPTVLFIKQIGYYSLITHWMGGRNGLPHSPDTESWRRNWKNPCMTCSTRFYTWRCSSSVLDHLFLTLFFPLSFTSHPLDLLSGWVLKLHIWGSTGDVSGAVTLPFAISMEDGDVILREQGIPEDGRHRKGVKHRESLSLNRREAAHWKRGGEPRQS